MVSQRVSWDFALHQPSTPPRVVRWLQKIVQTATTECFFHEARGLTRSTRGRLGNLNRRFCMYVDAPLPQTAIEQTSKLAQPGAIHFM